jgi:hypothetical protein
MAQWSLEVSGLKHSELLNSDNLNKLVEYKLWEF